MNFRRIGWFCLCLGLSVPAFSENLSVSETQATPKTKDLFITGTVVDDAGQALAGVTVMVKDTKTQSAAITDGDGHYILKIPNTYIEIQFTYLGYTTVVEKVSARKIINIVMKPSDKELGNVVVVGYGKQKKETVVGSIINADVQGIQKLPTMTLANALGGQIPGIITRQSSGEPGYDAATVYIRGLATWGNRAPLILVDGVQRDMNLINTQEIESISVLKDASATAIYGVQGANGVILITTKSGDIGQPTVTLRSEYGWQHGERYPNYINGYEYASLWNEARSNMGKAAAWTDEELQKFKDQSDPYLYPSVDWVDEILKKDTYMSTTNLTVNGGTERVRYFVNAGYSTQNGLYKEDDINKYNTNANYTRYNLRSKTDINLSKDLSLEVGLGGNVQKRTYPGQSVPAIWEGLRQTSPIAFPKVNPDGSAGGIMAYLGSNPWAKITQSGYSTSDRNSLQATFGARWDLSKLVTKGLSVNAKFAYDHTFENYVDRYKDFAVKKYLGKDIDGNDSYQILREEGLLGYRQINVANRAQYFESAINYTNTFGMSNLSGMLLYNNREYVDIIAGSSEANLPYRRQGIAGRLTYDYGRRYLGEFNFGYNGSEQFPKGKRYGFFPSLSLGWIASNEDFWNNNLISTFKLRGSLGQVGNDIASSARYLYLTRMNKNAGVYIFSPTRTIPDNNEYCLDEGQIGTSDISWEVATKANVGLDMGLFHDALTVQIDAFRENRDGILIQRISLPEVTGINSSTAPYGNLGKVKNLGMDGTVEYKHQAANGIYYSLKGNLSFAHNTILANDDPVYKYANQNRTGHPIDQPFGYIALGIFQSQDEIDHSPVQEFASVVAPGDIKYKDVNGDGVVNSYDETAIGHPRTPELMAGFGGTIAYKNFDFTLFFNGATRTSFFLDGSTMYPFYGGEGTFNVLRTYYDNRYVPGAEDNSRAKYPRVTDSYNSNNYITSTLWMKDGSFIRLKNAEIGYVFKQPILKKYWIDNIRVFVNGTNLYCWDHIKVVDPEADSGTGTYPQTRTINCGLQVKF
ncbi:MAG: TonB-dependent receptor [Bacteroidota bacterium]|nr:TonB-dependent receptor [Bacteroidota bacterium]